MPTIISVRKARGKNNCEVSFDNEISAIFSMDLVLKYALSKGKVLDDGELEEISNEQSLIDAKQTAYKYAAGRFKTEQEVWQKLMDSGFSDLVADKAISFCYEFRLLDDTEYAAKFVIDNANLKNKGPHRIRHELAAKGIDESIADEAIRKNYPYDKSLAYASQAAEKILKKNKGKAKLKIMASVKNHLLSRGYDFEIISKIMSDIYDDRFQSNAS